MSDQRPVFVSGVPNKSFFIASRGRRTIANRKLRREHAWPQPLPLHATATRAHTTLNSSQRLRKRRNYYFSHTPNALPAHQPVLTRSTSAASPHARDAASQSVGGRRHASLHMTANASFAIHFQIPNFSEFHFVFEPAGGGTASSLMSSAAGSGCGLGASSVHLTR